MVAIVSSRLKISSVLSDAAIDAAPHQNDPVMNTEAAASRNRSLPVTAASV